MIIDYIAIAVLVLCLITVIAILIRKFPIIAAINVDKLIRHKNERVKQVLIEERLKRKLSLVSFKKIFSKDTQAESKGGILDRLRKFVENLERQYQQKVKEQEPESQADVKKKKQIILGEAEKFLAEEKYKEAEGKYIEAISLDPKFIEAYKGLARVYTASKDFIHAKETYQFILKLNSSDDQSYKHLGQMASQAGDYQEAERDYLKSISLNNQVAVYHMDLGEVYVAMGEMTKAINSFKEAVKLEPNNPKYLDSVISASIKARDKKTAEEYLDKLVKVNPANEKIKDIRKEIDSL